MCSIKKIAGVTWVFLPLFIQSMHSYELREIVPRTPLQAACQRGDLDSVIKFFSQLEKPTRSAQDPIIENIERMHKLASTNPTHNRQDQSEIADTCASIIRHLAHKKDPIEEEQDIAAILAVQMGQKKVLEYLLDNGVPLNAGHNVDLVPINGLYDYNRNRTLMIHAALHNEPDIIDLLLSRGANPNECNRMLESPFICAAQKGNIKVVRRLLAFHEKEKKSGVGLERRRTIKHFRESREYPYRNPEVEQLVSQYLPLTKRHEEDEPSSLYKSLKKLFS